MPVCHELHYGNSGTAQCCKNSTRLDKCPMKIHGETEWCFKRLIEYGEIIESPVSSHSVLQISSKASDCFPVKTAAFQGCVVNERDAPCNIFVSHCAPTLHTVSNSLQARTSGPSLW